MSKFLQNIYPYDKRKEKGVMFFSLTSPKDAQTVFGQGIKEILVSYHYLRKRKKAFETETLPYLLNNGGLFMTDSGGFSFISGEATDEMLTEEFWLPYLEEYVQWLWDWKDYIFVAANLDLDNLVGREVVDKWNEKYFHPLSKEMNIVYVAHKDQNNLYADKDGLKRFKEYCGLYDYVGVNQRYKGDARKIQTIAKATNTRIHGFAWTSIPILKETPMFSVDSSTWAGGARYGTTYYYDGKNFKTIDFKNKHVRKYITQKSTMKENVDFEKVFKEDSEEVHKMNLNGWKGARREYLRAANCKLKNKPVSNYERSKLR